MDGAAGLRGRRRACLVAAALLGALIVSCRRHEPEGPVLTVLLTGFEPFGPYKINSSWESIKDIAADAVAGARINSRWTMRARRGGLIGNSAGSGPTWSSVSGWRRVGRR